MRSGAGSAGAAGTMSVPCVAGPSSSPRPTPRVALITAPALAKTANGPQVRDPAGLRRLQSSTGGTAQVRVSPATQAARFIRVPPGRALGRGAAATLAEKQAQSQAFFSDYAAAGLEPETFGIVPDSSRILLAVEQPGYNLAIATGVSGVEPPR